jgi:hypothetical protein
MISISPIGDEMARASLKAQGGFLWWYVDLVDETGDGVVVIWSFGLPFLPGYAEAARRGQAPAARQRPSLNVAVYRDWELDCYLLQEYEPEEVDWEADEGCWRFGNSRMFRAENGGERRVTVELDCPVPGSDDRLIGTVEADGVGLAEGEARRTDGAGEAHQWAPIAVGGRGRMDLRFGSQRYRVEGRAYHDSNSGTVPLHELGIRQWVWGRIPLHDRELIYYALWSDEDRQEASERFILDVAADGRVRQIDGVEVELRGKRLNIGGIRWWKRARLTPPSDSGLPVLEVEHRGVVDSGPFYMRYMTDIRAGDQRSVGFSELIRPHRVDMDRHRFFVQMRVDDRGAGRSNSSWLPLFTGPKRGRLERLVRYNLNL